MAGSCISQHRACQTHSGHRVEGLRCWDTPFCELILQGGGMDSRWCEKPPQTPGVLTDWWTASEDSKYKLWWSSSTWTEVASSLLWQSGPAWLSSSCPYLSQGWQQGWAVPCEQDSKARTKTRSRKAHFKGSGELTAIYFITWAPRQYFFREEIALVQMLTWKSHGRKICFILYIRLTSSAKT